MWASGRKVPQISLLEIIDVGTSFGVENSDSAFSLVSAEAVMVFYLDDISPFALIMPMQFSVYSWAKTHVDTCKLFAGGQFPHRGLSGPSSLFQTHVRIGE